jgi:hypothetical protein
MALLNLLADQRYNAIAQLARLAAEDATRSWQQVDPSDIRSSYMAVLPNVLASVTAGQLLAALNATDYVTAALDAQGDPGARGPAVDSAMLAGVASDGRPLETALLAPQVTTFRALAEGMEAPLALARGAYSLVRMVSTQVADAGRLADGLAVVADDRASGYYRKLTTPSCSRCAILAGRFYRYNAGFRRHPRCDCQHIPASEADDSLEFDTRAYFDSLSERDQDRIFTLAGAQAMRDGADPAQLVNARRGMTTASIGGQTILATTEGVTRRGWYAYVQRALDPTTRFQATPESRYRRAAKPRLMPEQIYSLAREHGWDRAEQVRQLKRNGYLLDGRSAGPHALTRIAADVLVR